MVVLLTLRHRRRALSITPGGAAQPGAHLHGHLSHEVWQVPFGAVSWAVSSWVLGVLVSPHGIMPQCCWMDTAPTGTCAVPRANSSCQTHSAFVCVQCPLCGLKTGSGHLAEVRE